jgi:hypothetical protein
MSGIGLLGQMKERRGICWIDLGGISRLGCWQEVGLSSKGMSRESNTLSY